MTINQEENKKALKMVCTVEHVKIIVMLNREKKSINIPVQIGMFNSKGNYETPYHEHAGAFHVKS